MGDIEGTKGMRICHVIVLCDAGDKLRVLIFLSLSFPVLQLLFTLLAPYN